MAIPSGLSAQVGIGEQVSYDTYLEPTRFHEFTNEDISAELGKLYTRGLGDRFQRSGRVRTYVRQATGSLEFDVFNTNYGLLFKHMLGSVAASQPDDVTTPLEYLYTFTPDSDGMQGLFTTVQVGRPSALDGTVHPFSYLGGKVTEWEISAEVDANLMLSTSWHFADVDVAQTLASATYPAAGEALPLSFIDGALTIDSTDTKVKAVNVAMNNAYDLDRRFLGNTKREPVPNGEAEVTGQFDMEFEDLSLYNDFLAGTEAALELTFALAGSEIDDGQANPYKLIITIPVVEYTGDADPNVGSSEVIQQSFPFKALYDGSTPIISLDYHTVEDTDMPAVA